MEWTKVDPPPTHADDFLISSLLALKASVERRLEGRYGMPLEDAEDVFQEALISTVNAQPRPDSPEAWLNAVLHNLAVAFVRRRARSRALFRRKHLDSILEPTRGHRFDIEGMLDALPPAQRHVIERLYLFGETSAEAASELHMTSASVRQSAFRAKRALRKKFAEPASQTKAVIRHKK
jgi:RNA polymerase sigma factor (sigma-70 family)